MMMETFGRRQRFLIWGVLWILMTAVTTSCSVKAPMGSGQDGISLKDQAIPQPKSIPQLTRIEATEDGQGTQILVEAEVPLRYTSYRLFDPPRLIVDLSDVSLGNLDKPIRVQKGAVLEIRPVETDIPNKVTRLEILLSEMVSADVEKENNRLMIRVAAPKSALPTAGAMTVAQDQAPADSSGAPTPADVLPEKTPAPTEANGSEPQGAAKEKSVAVVAPEQGQEPSPKVTPKVMKSPVSGREELPKTPKYTGRLISLDFQDAEVTNVLRLLADVSGKNMVMGENVKGKVTIKMLNIPWDQALDVVLKMKGFGKLQENNVIQIDTQEDIAKQQDDEAKAKDASVRAEDLKTRIFSINYARASELVEPLKKILSGRGDMTIDARTNTLIVKDVPDKIQEIKNVIDVLDLPTRQVLIEARIVQADTNFARDLGVQWGGDLSTTSGSSVFGIKGGNLGLATSPTTGFAVDLPASGVAGTLGAVGLSFGRLTSSPINLDLRLSAGESSGMTKIISSPKITTLDNREAKIEQGQSIPYQTSSANQGIKTEFVDATLTLTVTPKVTPDGHVHMKIKITKNRPGIPASSLVPPPIDKKEASTEVLVKDGETTVIGGIFEVTDEDSDSGVPWFSKLPVIGYLFKHTSRSDRKSELLIFITPKIITPSA